MPFLHPNWPVQRAFRRAGAIGFLVASICPASAKNPAKDGPRVEVKYVVPEAAIDAASKALELPPDPGETRSVTFYDTAALQLFERESKIILRARHPGTHAAAELTIKVRGTVPAQDGAECEFDLVVGQPKRSLACTWKDESVSVPSIVSAGDSTQIGALFAARLAQPFQQVAGKPLEQWKLIAFGPVEGVEIWKFERDWAPVEITVERWKLQREGKPVKLIFEVSMKVPPEMEEAAVKALTQKLGKPAGADGETKTKIVLEYFRK